MAVLGDIIIQNRVLTGAYIRASIMTIDKHLVNIKLEVWLDINDRNSNEFPLFIDSKVVHYTDLVNNNPFDYVYKLVELNGLITNAQYNI